MSECRNCGSLVVKELGSIGQVAPFVLKRVLNLEYGFTPAINPIKRILRRIKFLEHAFQRIYGTSILLEIQYCETCSFIQTKIPFREEALAKLYMDYRSPSYNQERIKYESSYASIAPYIGNCEQEVLTRVHSLGEWLMPKLETGSSFSMLDYGGADGKFLPDLAGQKYVFEISDIPPVKGVVRVKDEASLKSYSYVQLAHVLEHVSYPLELAKKASSYLERMGYFYVEVPQDLSDETVIGLSRGNHNTWIPIHEHINFYTVNSVTKLMESCGLSLLDIRAEVVDIGWSKPTIIRALGRKH